MTSKLSTISSTIYRRNFCVGALTGIVMFGLTAGYSSQVRAQGFNTPSQAQMWEIIQKQQRQIKRLQRAATGGSTVTTASTTEVGSAVTTDSTVANGSSVTTDSATNTVSDNTGAFDDDYGDAGAGWWTRTSIGGYGELHWNTGNVDEIDVHRFVLLVNHDFNDWIHFYSELELEHTIAGEGEVGQIELEQSWLRFDIKEDKFGPISRFAQYVDLGLMLVPVGIINELHEPTTFFGVERNAVENNIIPTTWREAGVRIGTESIGETGLGYDFMVHSGLAVPTTGSNAYKVRNGRQQVGKAPAEDATFTARVKYRPTFLPGWEIAGTYQYQEDITNRDSNIAGPDESATLWTTHIDGKQIVTDSIEFRLRALYARWDIDSTAAAALGRDQQKGWYVEPGIVYDTRMWVGKFGIFYRYEAFDNEAGAGDAKDTEIARQSYGANWWPTENVVIKAEYRMDDQFNPLNNDDRWDFGIGYQF